MITGVQKVLLSAAAFATAAFLAAPADAGVILTQPKLKKVIDGCRCPAVTHSGAHHCCWNRQCRISLVGCFAVMAEVGI